jgi:type III secretion protein V
LAPLPAVVLEGGPELVTAKAAAERATDRLREEFGAPINTPILRISPDLPGARYRLWTYGICIAEGEGLDDLEEVLQRALRRHLAQFVGIQETANLLNRWSRDYPDLVKEMLRAAAPQRVSEILRRLLEECIPIRHLRDVFEAITEVSARERDVVLVTEWVRVALRRHITQRHIGDDRQISALIAHPELEDALRQAARGGGQPGQVAIDPHLLQRVVAEIHTVRAEIGDRFARIVMLCSMDVRRHLRKLTETEFFELPVLSFQELSGDVPVVPLGQVRG